MTQPSDEFVYQGMLFFMRTHLTLVKESIKKKKVVNFSFLVSFLEERVTQMSVEIQSEESVERSNKFEQTYGKKIKKYSRNTFFGSDGVRGDMKLRGQF
jgi:hypothetical protein